MNGRPGLGAIGAALRAVARALVTAPETSDLFATRAEARALRPVALDRVAPLEPVAPGRGSQRRAPRTRAERLAASAAAPDVPGDLLSLDDTPAVARRGSRRRFDARSLASAVVAAEILAPPVALRNETDLRRG